MVGRKKLPSRVLSARAQARHNKLHGSGSFKACRQAMCQLAYGRVDTREREERRGKR